MPAISTVGLAETVRENRLSAEYFDPRYSFVPTAKYKWEKIGRVIRECQYGISVAMNEAGRGYPIFRMNEIVDCIAAEPRKFADISATDFQAFRLNQDDVLFNRTNSWEWVGRTGIVKNPLNAVFASYLIRIVVDERQIFPEFLTVYLSSGFGIGQIRRRAMPSINQANVSAYELKHIPIPLVDKAIQEEIAGLLINSYSERSRAKELYNAADALLEREMGIADVNLPSRNFTTTMLSSVVADQRSDAEHFQPQCEKVLNHLAQKGGTVSLSELLYFNRRGVQPTYGNSGPLVINSKHVRKNYVVLNGNRRGRVEEFDDPVYITTGDVLINGTGVGTIGRASIYSYSESALPDNHVTVLRTNKVAPAYLSVFLNTLPGQLQISKHLRGSSGQIEIYPADLAKVLIWKGSEALQVEITRMISTAHEASHKSKQLVADAKRYMDGLLADAVVFDKINAPMR